MKKMSLRTTVCCIACTMLAASATAQTPREPGSTPGSPSSKRSSTYSSSTHGQQQQSLRVSQQIINAQVKSQDGQQLGQIEDLIANPQTGRIEFAVISKGDKLCAIPMQLLQPQSGTSTTGTTTTSPTETPTTPSSTPSLSRSGLQGQRVTFVAQVDREKLEQAPSFSKSQWPDISHTWSQQIYSHFGVQPEAAGGTGSSTSSQEKGKSSSDDSSSDTEKRAKEKSQN